jgi:hypothetical protein
MKTELQFPLMADEHDEKARPETLVNRADRELKDLGKVAHKNWIVAVCIILVLGLYGAYEIGLFHKKDNPNDASADIVKLANEYIDLNSKYQKLQQQVQQKQDANKEEQLRQLKLKIDAQQPEINNRAQEVGEVMVPDPTTYSGVRVIPASAVDAWAACVQSTTLSKASATVGSFTFGGSSANSNNKCDAILQQNTNP